MQITFNEEEQGWSLEWGGLLLHLRLLDGALLGDYFGPASEANPLPGPEVFDTLARTRADASVQLAPDDYGVRWLLDGWTLPDESSLRITLRAKDVPLRAQVRFAVDPDTGILLRQTVLEHTGGPEIRISGAVSLGVVLPAEIREVVHLA